VYNVHSQMLSLRSVSWGSGAFKTARALRLLHVEGAPGKEKAKVNLFDFAKPQLADLFESLKKPKYRTEQLWSHLYRHPQLSVEASVDGLSTFSKEERAALAAEFSLDSGRIESVLTSVDGTKKFIVEVPSAGRTHKVECVYIPKTDEEEQTAASLTKGTLCVSSQAGCSLSCSFCHTGTQALEGNLSPAAIVSQYRLVANHLLDKNAKISNIVFMGQGEPFYTWRNVKRAVSILTDPSGIALPAQRITISTSGVAPLIPALADYSPESGVPVGIRLALSLHAPNDALRTQIMSINKQYPLGTVMGSCALYLSRKLKHNEWLASQEDRKGAPASPPAPLSTSLSLSELCRLQAKYGEKHGSSKHRSRITFEYVLLKGVNDSLEHADELKSLLASYLPLDSCHINLLPFHPWPGSPYEAPEEEAMLDFQSRLESRYSGGSSAKANSGKRLQVHIRKSRGLDILGACGQLRSSDILKGSKAVTTGGIPKEAPALKQ
jgi:23S rRNA (adenine2503-C2)-methyltransferase